MARVRSSILCYIHELRELLDPEVPLDPDRRGGFIVGMNMRKRGKLQLLYIECYKGITTSNHLADLYHNIITTHNFIVYMSVFLMKL